MKTFTTYAEKKAKQFLNLLQGYTKGIRMTAILILLLMGVSNAWAASEGSSWYDWASSENVYFDNTNSSYTNVSMLIGRKWNYGGDGVGSSGVNFTKVENTNNLYHAATTWNHYNTLLFIDAKDWGWEGNMVTQRCAYANNHTNTNNVDINGTELFYAASNEKDATLNHEDLNDYAALNYQQTIQSAVNGAVANSKATISITSYKMSAHKTTTEQTATLGTGANVSYITAARTAITTLEVGDVATGYQFDGWYTAATGGTQLSTDETYTYYPTTATTVYARFSTKQHKVNFGVHSSGHGSLTAKVGDTSISSGNRVNYGSEVVFTAEPDDGYQIKGWYSNSACTEPIDNGTNDTYTVKIKGGTNVYVEFEAIPANIHNITYTEQETGWTYGDSNPTTAEEGATVTFVVNPTAGYRVDVSSDGPALTGPNANNQYTFTMPNKDVKITVEAKPEQYTITLNDNGGSGGSGTVTATYLAPMPSVTPPTLIGYTFNGYFDAASGGTKYYNADGSSAKNWDKTSNTILYAQWTANQYTITYKDQNNADFSGVHASGHPTTHTYGTATTLKDATKTGYTFDGWFTTSACTGTEVTSLGATTYTSDITLYAKWTEIPPTTVYLKPNDNWKQDNARFAIYCWNNEGNIWYDMTKMDCDGGNYYMVEIPVAYKDFKFVRLNPATTENNWNDGTKWNETGDLKVPTDSKVLFTVTDWGNGSWGTYSAPQYTITITNGTGGTVTVKQEANTITSGNKVNLNAVITATLAANDGYSKGTAKIKIGDNAEADLVEGQEYTICGPTTITATWKPDSHTVTFDANGHGTAPGEQSVDYNAKVTKPADPTADGYDFGGWYTDADCTNAWNFNTDVVTEDMTLYAKWTATVYTITYNDLYGVTHSNPATYNIESETITFTPPTSTRTGYDFAGWNPTEITKGSTGNKNVTAQWTEILSTITIKTNPAEGGSIEVDGQPFTPGNTVQVGVATFKLVTAVPNEGYGVAQWGIKGSATFGGGSTTFKLYGNGTNAAGELIANFIGKEYTITFDRQDGTGGTEKATVNYKNNNYSITPVIVPTRTGYIFGGYYTEANGAGVQVVSAEGAWLSNATGYTNGGKWIKADNVTLYAKWTESQAKHDVRVLYMCGDVVVKEAETIAVGEILPTSITAPTVTGYTFSEWKLGDGLVTENNLTAYTINLKTKSSGDYTLTANYIKYQYTLTFGVLGYGGSVSAIADGNEIASPAPLGQDSKVILTATAKDGYEFYNWIDANGNEVSKVNPYVHTMTASTTINAVFKNTRMLYLKPNEGWKGGDARFAAYFYRDGSGDNYWADMTSEFACDNPNDIYKVPIPDGTWTHVIFVRMNPSFNENRWNRDDDGDNKPVWNQTADLDLRLLTNGNNLFKLPITGDQYWNGATTTWEKHTSEYKPVYLTYNVEVPEGTPNCYISGKMNGWSFTEMEKIDDTHYTITIQDACSNDEYKYCYGPSWGCQEVKKSDFTAINNRTHKNSDKVEAWIKYCLVGNNNIGWSWNDAYSFDIAGDMSHDFNANNNYGIKVMSSTQKYYTHNEHPYNLHRSHTSVKIPHEGGENNQLILQADLTGTYKFHFDPVSKLLTIVFPEKGYRLKITMTDGSKKVYTSNAVDDETETLSFFAPGTNDPNLKGTITLEHLGSIVSEVTAPTITESGVYTAKLNSAKNGITDIALYDGNYYIRTDGANGGWSNYKTDSDNKMTYFVPREEEKYSYYWVQALPRAPRDHTNGVVNVKACVANDYNDNLAIMLEADKFTSDNYGNVNILDPDEHHREKINVRFGYNPKTNHFERAMLTGSGNINTFLNIFDPLPEGYLYKTNNNGTLETQLTAASQDNKFTDISNWVYERDVWVNVQNDKDVTVCLTAVSYNGARNSLFGFDDEAQTVPTQRTIVAKNSTQEPKKMRVIYDFKTNRMIMAWMPGAYNCTGEEALIADVLFMRHENDPVPQLTMQDNNTTDNVTPQIKGIQTQFFALELENKGNQNYEEHYWITLPFNCIVGSISGVPGYMQTWGIQRYNGKKRAEKGWWKETETFWEWLGPDDVMEAGVGYVLSFDKKAATWNTFDVHTEHDDGSVTTTQKSLLRLYFPSTEKDFTFKANNNFVKTYADEPCEIKTANRHLQDGNWKIIGPLSYNSATATASPTTGDQVWQPEENGDHITVPDGDYNWAAPMFLYEYTYDNSTQYNRENNWKYVVKNTIGYTYKAFFGYMVQFAGTMTWYEISQSIHPKLRARTYTDQVPTNITTNLELVDAEGVQHDQTFVALDVEGTTTYDLNKDLNKVFNNNFANIYTLSENIPFAGNTLPMEKAIVPVGVRIATAGEYTFRMPDGTEGINVTLIDNQTGTQTDMLMSEYTITLDAGTIENRFYLVVDPDRTATSVENIGEEAKGEEAKGQIKKFLIDGKLFIRTADGIFDAKGQRM